MLQWSDSVKPIASINRFKPSGLSLRTPRTCAAISNDGSRDDLACGRPSRRAARKRGLLRTRQTTSRYSNFRNARLGHELREQFGVDIATREHHDHSLAGNIELAGEKRCECDRPARLDNQLQLVKCKADR